MFTKMFGFGKQIQNLTTRISYVSVTRHYNQGQSFKPGVREYFYYIDHQGMLFLDDARIKNFTSCFKEIKFLNFFFERLRMNETGFYEKEFPYLSPCGRERNFVRCDDLPIVFTKLETVEGKLVLPYNYCGTKFVVDFQPQKLYMGASGRVYHPGPERLHGLGLVKSQLAIELSQGFTFGEDGKPTSFTINNLKYDLDNSLSENLVSLGRKDLNAVTFLVM